MKEENETLLLSILNDAYPGQWVPEHIGIPGFKYRFDAAHIGMRIAIEIDGGIHPFYITKKDGSRMLINRGGHSSAEGIQRDMDKANEAQLCEHRWIYLRYTPGTLKANPIKIIKDVWKILGKPTGKSVVDIERHVESKKRTYTRKAIAKIDGQLSLGCVL